MDKNLLAETYSLMILFPFFRKVSSCVRKYKLHLLNENIFIKILHYYCTYIAVQSVWWGSQKKIIISISNYIQYLNQNIFESYHPSISS